jgi:hypothetical protein
MHEVPLAYIDPATGAIVLQAAIAGVLAVGVACRRFLVAPFSLLRGRVFHGRHGQAAAGDGSGAREET